MIDVKSATQGAISSFNHLYDNRLELLKIQLEEVELTEDGKYWLVTLSYPIENAIPGILQVRKEYKVLKLDAETGALQSMKMREVA